MNLRNFFAELKRRNVYKVDRLRSPCLAGRAICKKKLTR
jgi:hypothetical protein